MQCKIQTLYNNKAVTQPQPLSYFYQLFPTDSEHGLHDGISVKVNTPADVRTIRVFSSWKRKCICLCFLQLLQHQVGGAVPGNHSSGVSFCHHLQLPEQGANCFKLELQTALNKKKTPIKTHLLLLLQIDVTSCQGVLFSLCMVMLICAIAISVVVPFGYVSLNTYILLEGNQISCN